MRPSLQLPRGTTVLQVADASRAALDEFLELYPSDKFALSNWLIGSYRKATSYGPRRAPPALSAESDKQTSTASPVSMVISHTQAIVRAALQAATKPGADGLLSLMPAVVDVIPVHDMYGGHGFAAIDQPNAKLDARVLSLLLADYLTRPDEYVDAVDRPPRRYSTGKLRALSG